MNVLRSSELSLALLIRLLCEMTCLLGFAWIIATACASPIRCFSRAFGVVLRILGSLTLPFAHVAAFQHGPRPRCGMPPPFWLRGME